MKPDKNGKVDLQNFFDFVMSACRDMLNDEILSLKRELKDQSIMIKVLRNKNKDLELEFKSLGIAISQLGVTEINILNDTKNMIKEKLSVVDFQGRIRGRADIQRFNITIKENKAEMN